MSKTPGPIPGVPAIPQPVADPASVPFVLQALKQGLEALSGQRGDPLNRAVTFNDLARLQLASVPAIQSPSGSGETGGGSSTTIADLPAQVKHTKFVLSIAGTLDPSTDYWTVPIDEPVTVPAGWTAPASVGVCRTPAASVATVLTVSYLRGGTLTTIGTVTFSVGANAATLAGPGATLVLQTGDVLVLASGAAVDATLANVGFVMTTLKQ